MWIFGLLACRIPVNFLIEERLLCEVRNCRKHFVLAPVVTRVQVLRSEEFTFQLTAYIYFLKEEYYV